MHIKSTLIRDFVVGFLLFSAFLLFAFSRADGRSGYFSRHNSILCANCHLSVAGIQVTGYRANDIAARCRICHNDYPAERNERRLGFHQQQSKTCLDCHSFHDSDLLKAGDRVFRFSYGDSETATACYICHNGRSTTNKLSAAHKKASRVFHVDTGAYGKNSDTDGCASCHSSHRATAALENLKCAGCHNLAAKNSKSLALLDK